MRALRSMVCGLVLCRAAVAVALGPQVVQTTLSNGATLLVSEQHNLPMVRVHVLIDAGARRDPPGRGGLANLTADLLTEGTATRSAAAIKEAIDFIGGSLQAETGLDYAQVRLHVLRKDLDAGLDLLADVLLRPAFRGEELTRRREAVLAAIRAGRDDPTELASRAFRRALFGAEPYGHEVEGDEESVPRITGADIEAFYRSFYRPNGALVVVVGDVSAQDAQARLERHLAAWNGSASRPFAYPTPATPTPRTERVDRPVTQASIILGHRGIARDNPDFEAIAVMNYILGGGGFSSRLMDNIRTRAGLAYSVASFFAAHKAPGSFQVVMQTKNESVADAIGRARAEIERIRTEPVSDEELSDAKRYLTGSFPLRLDSNAKIADFITQVSFYGLGLDYADQYIRRVNAVTKEDVQRVAQQYLHPDGLIEVIVANLGKAKLPER